jgi:hypothetical protein
MAFVIAGLVAILTLLFAMMQACAAGGAYFPGDDIDPDDVDSSGASMTLTVGFSIALLIAASHWLAWPW